MTPSEHHTHRYHLPAWYHRVHADQNAPILTYLELFFSLFFLQSLPMGADAPTRTILHPSEPIYDNYCLTPQNMMSGENSPAIAPKYCPEAPLIPCLALILDCPCTLSPNAPIRAHPHPFEPMYTHLYPKLHVYIIQWDWETISGRWRRRLTAEYWELELVP